MTTWSLKQCDSVLTSLHYREQYYHININYILFWFFLWSWESKQTVHKNYVHQFICTAWPSEENRVLNFKTLNKIRAYYSEHVCMSGNKNIKFNIDAVEIILDTDILQILCFQRIILSPKKSIWLSIRSRYP